MDAATYGRLSTLTQLCRWATELGVAEDMLLVKGFGLFRRSITFDQMDIAAQLYA